jgi:hypothetical protein
MTTPRRAKTIPILAVADTILIAIGKVIVRPTYNYTLVNLRPNI